MPNLYLFFSHTLAPEQLQDVHEKLGCENIVSLPGKLQQLWQQIPPEGEITESSISPFINYLSQKTEVGDYILVQGEFGVSFAIVSWCFQNNRIPIYATTKRDAVEKRQPDGSIKKLNIFKHEQFRRYKR